MDASVATALAPAVVLSVGASIWGAINLERGTRFRARLFLGTDFMVPKWFGLLLWPVMVVIIWLGVSMAAGEPRANDQGYIVILGTFALIVVVIGQISGIRRARSH